MTIAERETQILRIKSRSFQSGLTEALDEQIRARVVSVVQTMLKAALVEEVLAFLTQWNGARPRRSGYFKRQTDTQYGRIPDLRVPKLRWGNPEREWQVLQRYQRARPGLLDWLAYLYVMGLSLRDLQEALFLLMGEVLSRSAINAVTLRVQALLDNYRDQPVTGTPPVLIVDGVWVDIQYTVDEFKCDRAGHERQCRHAQERVILAVMGVFPDGSTSLLHFEVAEAEEEAQWRSLFEHLLARGLEAQAVALIVSDGARGLPASMKVYFPNAKHQRCITHKVRGMQRYLLNQELPEATPETSTYQLQQERWHELKTDAYTIYEAATREEAQARLTDFEAKWQTREPQAVHSFVWGFQATLHFYHFESHLHPIIRTTNHLERLFREFRNKADEIGAFPNEQSCLTLFFLVVQREHAKHDRPFMAKT
ncbi:MAG TPA: IS256 family transposase [Anaerolineae bacterium]|nr:IS256 family transposase [Anaerolineae bacterium]HQI87343.1 IS256 family transposase [Anaerolineae bacterium]